MAAQQSAYNISTEVRNSPLTHIDVAAIREASSDPWMNQTLCRVNDSVVRLGVVQGEFHWHKHDDTDEFFYCVTGRLFVDIENGQTFELDPEQCVTVPRGVVHRTRAPERTSMLMMAISSVVPTGS